MTSWYPTIRLLILKVDWFLEFEKIRFCGFSYKDRLKSSFTTVCPLTNSHVCEVTLNDNGNTPGLRTECVGACRKVFKAVRIALHSTTDLRFMVMESWDSQQRGDCSAGSMVSTIWRVSPWRTFWIEVRPRKKTILVWKQRSFWMSSVMLWVSKSTYMIPPVLVLSPHPHVFLSRVTNPIHFPYPSPFV